MAEKKNGEKGEVTVEEQKSGDEGFKFKGAPLGKHSFTSGFENPDNVNNIKYLVETGDNPRDLFMRTLFPTKITRSYRIMVALQTELNKCIKFKDEEGAEAVRNILAMLPSLDGEGRKQLVASFIGGYFGDKGGGGGGSSEGMEEKLKRIALGH